MTLSTKLIKLQTSFFICSLALGLILLSLFRSFERILAILKLILGYRFFRKSDTMSYGKGRGKALNLVIVIVVDLCQRWWWWNLIVIVLMLLLLLRSLHLKGK